LDNKYKGIEITENYTLCAYHIKSRYRDLLYNKNTKEDLENLKQKILNGNNKGTHSEYGTISLCEHTFLEASIKLAELMNGIATPIKVTFNPDNAFYPQEISKVNSQTTTTQIEIYLLSNTPLTDANNLFDISNRKEYQERYNGRVTPPETRKNIALTNQQKETLQTNHNYATKYSYRGPLANFEGDSEFTPTDYESSLDPTKEKYYKTSLVALFFLFLLIPILAITLSVISRYTNKTKLIFWTGLATSGILTLMLGLISYLPKLGSGGPLGILLPVTLTIITSLGFAATFNTFKKGLKWTRRIPWIILFIIYLPMIIFTIFIGIF
jgi:hypothetical protein